MPLAWCCRPYKLGGGGLSGGGSVALGETRVQYGMGEAGGTPRMYIYTHRYIHRYLDRVGGWAGFRVFLAQQIRSYRYIHKMPRFGGYAG